MRYRLTKSDISSFANDGYLQEPNQFCRSAVINALKVTEADTLTAIFPTIP